VIGDIGEGDYLRPRYFKGENIKHGLRSFVGIPLGQAEGAWGCFTLEHKRPGLYGDKAKDVLLQFGAQLELGLEKIRIARSIKTVKPGDSPLPRFELE
jgi:GAF domain-containing protein